MRGRRRRPAGCASTGSWSRRCRRTPAPAGPPGGRGRRRRAGRRRRRRHARDRPAGGRGDRDAAGTSSRPAPATTSPALLGLRRRTSRWPPRTSWPAGRSARSTRPGRRDRWFGGVLSSGFDSRVNERANRMRWPHGPHRYNLAMLAGAAGRSARCRSRWTSTRVEPRPRRCWSRSATAPRTAAACGSARAPLIDDGLLDVTVLGRSASREFLRVVPQGLPRHPRLAPGRDGARAPARSTLRAPGVVAYADGERVRPAAGRRAPACRGALDVLVAAGRPPAGA